MNATTSLKLPEALKAQIAQTAIREGKTAHALMVDTLQAAMDQAALRQQFEDDGDAAYQEVVASNTSYSGDAVHAYFLAKARGESPARPPAKAHDPSKPMNEK